MSQANNEGEFNIKLLAKYEFDHPQDVIYYLRKSLHLTQGQFSKKCGITRSKIGRFERGESPINCKDFFEIVKACGFSIRLEIIGEDDGNEETESTC